jgi:Tol biopolymer transport system component
MAIVPGTHLGRYEVLSELGAGGMGEVYRAHDPRLGREVALKIVQHHLSDDPDHMGRFRREAQVLAALNHPHIAAIYELDEADGTSFLVMELVPGETLAQRLSAGSLAVPEALRICSQIAEAVEAAHDKGIIHRDLKPANIKITPDNVVKVLDFGLAKALEGRDSTSGLSHSLTHSLTAATGAGTILGTARYMSPEQARGKPVDRRSDIWSFGCVMFEALTNSRPFDGETVSDTLVSILEREPDWRLLPATTPTAIRHLLRRCLQKDLQRRLRDIGDARLEIEDVLAGPVTAVEPAGPEAGAGRRWRLVRALAWLTIGAVAGALFGAKLKTDRRSSDQPASHFVVTLPPAERLSGLDFPAVAVSPDGSRLAYIATRGGRPQLFVRPMNSLDAVPIPGTTDASGPFFSPDNRWIAFFAAGKLKKVSVAGGTPVTVCDAAIGVGGSWGNGDAIVFASTTGSSLSQVPAAGGIPSRATTLDAEKGEFSHRWPEWLPDGKTVLFTVGTVGSWDDAQIVAQSLTSGQRHVLIQGGTHPRYSPTGHLVYARGGALLAVQFDPARLKIAGAPVRVLDRVLQSFDGAAQVSLTRSGSIVYVPGTFQSVERRLISVDRGGAVAPFAAPPRVYSAPRFSPDGRRLLVTIAGATDDLWVYDIPQDALKQLTFDASNSSPAWTPDGDRVVFSSNRGGAPNLFWTRVDGSGAGERLASSDDVQVPGSWSPDGRLLAFTQRHATTGRDIWMLPSAGDRKPYPYLTLPSDESAPAFSRDGRWIAYVSNESGRSEVYVSAVADPSRKRRVSTTGGAEPVWGRNGREIFFRAGERMMVVAVSAGAEFRAAEPRVFLEGTFEKGTVDTANYDVAPDARLVMVKATGQESVPRELHVLLNWLDSVDSATAPRR